MADPGDFFNQITSLVLLQILLFGTPIVLYIVYAVYIRPARRRQQQASPPSPEPSSDTADLPDLQTLLDPAAPITKFIPSEPQPVQLSSGQIVQAVEVLSVLRDVSDGSLMIQMGDTAYRSLQDVPDVRRRFVSTMKALSGVVQATDKRPEVIAADEPPPAPKPPEPSAAAPTAGPLPGDLPRPEDQPEQVTRGFLGRKKVIFSEMPQLDIAGAIEAYLQYKLQSAPEFAGRELHVHPGTGGMVRIQVDAIEYDAVDAIDDEAVRAFLQATIREWQERQ